MNPRTLRLGIWTVSLSGQNAHVTKLYGRPVTLFHKKCPDKEFVPICIWIPDNGT